MTTFWALAWAMILLGFVWVIPPLFASRARFVSRREEQNIEIARERLRVLEAELRRGAIDSRHFEQGRVEIEQILANDLALQSANADSLSRRHYGLKTAFAVILCVPMLTILLYGMLGNPQGLSVKPGLATIDPEHPGNAGQTASVLAMVQRLEERLKTEPNQPEGWRLLARSYTVLERYPEAIEALRKARALAGDDPDLLVQLADLLAASQNGSFDGEAADLIRTVLRADPKHPAALWMAGRAAIMRRELAQALTFWRQLQAVIPNQGEGAEMVRAAIARVEQAAGQTGDLAQAPAIETPSDRAASQPAATTSPAIQVQVALDPALASAVSPDDTVFVYAQALNGPPMPLAVSRNKVSELPLRVTLNDAMAMMPQLALSKFPEVRIIARISKTGNAMPQSGDFKGQFEPVSVAQQGPVDIVIADKIP